ncbi:MAG TPA: trigger factor, partial [Bacillota bacterium]|nr:trigger factor [Bacillota bacterium]
MSLKNVKEIEKNRSEMEILIPRMDFDAAVVKAYHKNVSKINIPGFRKGKAPKGIIEKMYGKTVFYDDAIDTIFPEFYGEALKESGLEAVSRPEIDLGDDDENGIVIITKIYTKPVLELGEYKGYEIEKEEVVVSDEDVEEELKQVQKKNGRLISVEDRPLANGDTAKFDFEGFCDGVPFEGGKAEDYSLAIGSGQFIPGFEDQMIGHKLNEEFEINVKFPEDYSSEELKGKDSVFKIKLKGIQMTELPELDDEFAKDVSEFENIAEYKNDIKAKITERRQAAADGKYDEALQDELLKNVTVDLPVCMIDEEIDGYIRDYDSRLQNQGGSVDMYLKYMGMTMEQMRENFKERAERSVKLRMALEAIAEKEALTASDEQIEDEYKNIAEAYNMKAEDIKKSVGREMLEPDIKLRNAVALLRANAKAPAAKVSIIKFTHNI